MISVRSKSLLSRSSLIYNSKSNLTKSKPNSNLSSIPLISPNDNTDKKLLKENNWLKNLLIGLGIVGAGILVFVGVQNHRNKPIKQEWSKIPEEKRKKLFDHYGNKGKETIILRVFKSAEGDFYFLLADKSGNPRQLVVEGKEERFIPFVSRNTSGILIKGEDYQDIDKLRKSQDGIFKRQDLGFILVNKVDNCTF